MNIIIILMLKGFKKLQRLTLYTLQYESKYQFSTSSSDFSEEKEPQPLKKVKLNDTQALPQNGQTKKSIVHLVNEPHKELNYNPPQPTLKQNNEQQQATDKKKQDLKKQHCDQLFTKYPKIVGLINMGNTCYLNSALQNVLSTPILNEHFLGNQLALNPNHKNVALQYQSLVKRMRSQGKNIPEAPSHLKAIISKVARKFNGFRQEDSQEFLRALLDCLHSDLNRVTKKPPYKELKADIQNLQQTSDEWFSYFKQRDDSIITDLFAGQLLNRVVCTTCNYESIAFDNFQELSLSFSNNNQKTDLSQLIMEFLQDEVLENSYSCTRCKKVRRCVRKFDIHRLPTILVIHLKRFLFGRYKREKILQKVTFPTNLNLTKFIKNSSIQKLFLIIQDDKSVQNCQYELYGIVNHYGDLNFGHYTAECKHPFNHKWYSYNDESVFSLNIEGKDYDKIGSTSPYLLFYCKT